MYENAFQRSTVQVLMESIHTKKLRANMPPLWAVHCEHATRERYIQRNQSLRGSLLRVDLIDCTTAVLFLDLNRLADSTTGLASPRGPIVDAAIVAYIAHLARGVAEVLAAMCAAAPSLTACDG
jgi:hypothetical protein